MKKALYVLAIVATLLLYSALACNLPPPPPVDPTATPMTTATVEWTLVFAPRTDALVAEAPHLR